MPNSGVYGIILGRYGSHGEHSLTGRDRKVFQYRSDDGGAIFFGHGLGAASSPDSTVSSYKNYKSVQEHLARAKELGAGSGKAPSEGESVHGHLQRAYILAQKGLYHTGHPVRSGFELLGHEENDQVLFEVMGISSQEYHHMLRDADLAVARAMYQAALDLRSGEQPAYDMLSRSIEAYKDAALHEAFANQSLPVDRYMAVSQRVGYLRTLLEGDELSIAYFKALLQEEGIGEIQRILTEAHRVDTRENDWRAAEEIDRILKTTGLDLHSPTLMISGVDPEEIRALRVTSFGDRLSDLIDAFTSGFFRKLSTS
ncbi:MAG: hypothetical protein H6858_04440 [Rhodospirillales bacterium]|nr:hypothetical protein [Alphaproteobacteria bacterium]MCB1840508.1 hypothetical protein [Alphaproteobacteria bacterium]MCB9976834.1 hypothetical protein [Rhodospirillales bacterium]